MTKWKYTVSLETPNINGSGSTFSMIVETYDKNKAFELYYEGRNCIERSGKIGNKIVNQFFEKGQWLPN